MSFDDKLDAYAEVMVAIGLNLRPGQRLIVDASTEAAPLVRKVAAHALRAREPRCAPPQSATALSGEGRGAQARARHEVQQCTAMVGSGAAYHRGLAGWHAGAATIAIEY